jgi:hypothetical protein
LVIRDEAVIALPIIGDERLAFEADFVEELLACGVIAATKNPGDGSPSNRVVGSPKPQFLTPFFYKAPHLVESDDNHFSLGRWLGKLARFVADPVQNGHVADAENARDGAKAHVAHGVEKQGQILHMIRSAAACNEPRSWQAPFTFAAKGFLPKWLIPSSLRTLQRA